MKWVQFGGVPVNAFTVQWIETDDVDGSDAITILHFISGDVLPVAGSVAATLTTLTA